MIARLHATIVRTLAPKILKQRELKYGDKGPLKYATSVYRTLPAESCQGT